MNKKKQFKGMTQCIVLFPLFFLLLLSLGGCGHFQKKEKIATTEKAAETIESVQAVAAEEPLTEPSSTPNLLTSSGSPSNTVWQDIVQAYGLPEVADQQVANHLRWYSNNQAYLDRSLAQSRSQIYHVTQVLRANNLPTELALLPVVESSYNPFAVSPSKAVGIWQFMTRTGRSFGLKQNHWYDGRRDLIASTDAAVAYLTYLHKMFDGDWLLAIAAYNAGEGTLQRAIKKNRRLGKPIDFWSLPLPRQTESYVPQLVALAKIIKNPQQYALVLHEIPNQPFFTTVTVQNPIDLNQAAKMAEIDPVLLRNLNAGYNRWVTDPSGTHQLLVPIEKAEQFSLALDKLPKVAPIKILAEHKIKSGDTLGAIAKRYGTSVAAIQTMNNMKATRLKPGQVLTIPGAAKVDSPHSTPSYAYATSSQPAENLSTATLLTETLSPETSSIETISKGIYHTVKSGDSLWTISRKYNTTIDKICLMNNLSKKSTLQPKQKLLVVSNNLIKREGNKIIYQIEHGDTIHRIASMFAVSRQDILSWNMVKDESYIHPGQELTIYVNPKN